MATGNWRGADGTWNGSSTANWAASSAAATFTASRSSTTLTVTAVASGALAVGDTVWRGTGTSLGTIVSQDSGTPGSTGDYTTTGSGSLSSQTMSSATIGATVPTGTDNVVFDADSNVGTGNFTTTLATNIGKCNDFTISGLDGTMTLAGSVGLEVSGSLSWPASNLTRTYTGAILFNATSAGKTITLNGNTLGSNVTVNGVSGAWTMGSAFTTSGSITVTNGAADWGTYTNTCSVFASNNTNTRGLTWGSGAKVVLTGNNTTVWNCSNVTNLTVSGTPRVESSYSGATGTRTFTHGVTGGAEATAVNIYVLSGTDTVAVSSHVNILDFTGFAGTFSNNARTHYGSLTFASGMTPTAGTGAATFAGASGTKVITSAGVTLDFPITVNGAGATWQLADAMVQGSTRLFALNAGKFDTNGKATSVGTFQTSGTTAREIDFTTATFTVLGSGASAFNAANLTNATITYSAGAKIDMTSGSAKTFIGQGGSWPTLNQGGAGDLTIVNDNTFADITNSVNSCSVLFTAGSTNTFSAFSLSGTPGNPVTIDSTTSSPHTLSKASGTVRVSNCIIKNSHATGGAVWDANLDRGNVDGGGNTGWYFGAPLDDRRDFFFALSA